jgi:SAM-dependent methyltransferase
LKVLKTFIRNWVGIVLPLRQWWALPYLWRYVRHWRAFQAASTERLRLRDSYPCLTDWLPSTPFDPHYFYQGAWIARKIAARSPALHVDVGSSVLTMSVLSAQVPTVFIDYRPLQATLPNLSSVAGDILSLPFADRTLHSLSCMHVLEHIGLGRYGDPIDPMGSQKGALELARILAPQGRLYITVPIGRPRVCFNAHRVFAPQDIPTLLTGLQLTHFSWVDDAGLFHDAADPADAIDQDYACGFYELVKIPD